MPPKFGTSGLRGLVTELTPDLVQSYTFAFLESCATGSTIHIGWDLRPSSPAIADSISNAIKSSGRVAIVHGAVPTPALALAAKSAGNSAIMITGSHIPADRNGLKFYTVDGELSKDDEVRILAALGTFPNSAAHEGTIQTAKDTAMAAFIERYISAFGGNALTGMRVGIYQHSSVARDLMVDAINGLGGVAIPLACSDTFIPVDTEAIDPETRTLLTGWCHNNNLDALISTDGDADRPMVADTNGSIIPGDVLGVITARMIGANIICTPISSNTMLTQLPEFDHIELTRIGSPFVIAAMEQVLNADAAAKVAGFEANGGFLLGFTAQGPNGPLSPLMTRDCLLPIVAPLAFARQSNQSLAKVVKNLPNRFTAADRLTGIEPSESAPFLKNLIENPLARQMYFSALGEERTVDLTDGLRITFASGDVVHLRPSGNAPEFRCYTEAGTASRAQDILNTCFTQLTESLPQPVSTSS